jgi:hypothetical protein
MLSATANQLLPTTITRSLPPSSWCKKNLGLKSFFQATVETRRREHYRDALFTRGIGGKGECIAADPNLTLLNIPKK